MNAEWCADHACLFASVLGTTIAVGGRSVVAASGQFAYRLPGMAQRYDATPRQIVLAWLLARSPAILPIPGTGSVSHLDDNVATAAIKLTPADVAFLTDSAG